MGTTRVSNRAHASRSSGQVSFRILDSSESGKKKKKILVEEILPVLEGDSESKKKEKKKRDPEESKKVVENVKSEIERVMERIGGIKYYGS